jgi:hypothetical protein
MLKEITKPRQNAGETRRIFSDEFFDLYVWYDSVNEILGFQLCYSKNDNEHCVNWKKISGKEFDGEFSHYKVDAGEDTEVGHFKMKPVLQPDGIFDRNKIVFEFEKSGASLDENLREFILNKLKSVSL